MKQVAARSLERSCRSWRMVFAWEGTWVRRAAHGPRGCDAGPTWRRRKLRGKEEKEDDARRRRGDVTDPRTRNDVSRRPNECGAAPSAVTFMRATPRMPLGNWSDSGAAWCSAAGLGTKRCRRLHPM